MAELKEQSRKHSGLPASKGTLSPVKKKACSHTQWTRGIYVLRKLGRKRRNTVTAHTLPQSRAEGAQPLGRCLQPAGYLQELGQSGAAQGPAFFAGVAAVPRDEGWISSEVWISSRS